jgi:Glycosyltransferase family 87
MKTRAQRLTFAMILAFAIAGVIVVTHQSSLARRSADFTIDYSAALLIRNGHPDAIYDPHRLGPLMLRLSDQAIDPRLPFDAPLAMALPYVPLTLLPLEVAFHVWQGITLALLVLALALLSRWIPLGRRASWIGLLALLGFPATWALLSEGQSSAMLLVGAVLLVGAWRRGSPVLAAAGGFLLAMKPQYLPVYLILFVMARSWRVVAAAILGGVAVALSPLMAGGVHGLAAMIWSALDAGQGVIRYNESLIATLAPFLPGSWPTYVGFALWGLVLIALTALAIQGPQPALSRARGREFLASDGGMESSAEGLAVLFTATGLVFAPHALPYDIVLLAVPIWLAFALHQRAEIPNPAPAGFVIAVAMVIDLGRPIVSLAPVVMLVCLAIYGRVYLKRRTHPERQVRAA